MQDVKPVLICLLFLGGVFCKAEIVNDPRQTAVTFLSDWLVQKRLTRVRNAFAKDAFTSKVILSESCAGYIKDEDRNHPQKVEQLVMSFMEELLSGTKGRSLKTILVFREFANGTETGGKILATPDKDGYLLVEGTRLGIRNKEDWAYLSTKYPSDKYLAMFAMIKTQDKGDKIEFPIYFVWARINGHWKIIHVGVECI